MTARADAGRLAILAHEVRSPVAALAAIARAARGNDLSEAEWRQLLALAARACRAIERIVADATVASVRRERVAVAMLLREIAATAALAGASVRVDVPTELPDVAADPVRIRQALDNLLANAVAHAPAGSEVVLSAVETEEGIGLSVADEGPGLPSDLVDRIFEPGERLDAAYPGSGLGLAVARAIAEAHGGRLTVATAPGEGATFTLVLPREAAGPGVHGEADEPARSP